MQREKTKKLKKTERETAEEDPRLLAELAAEDERLRLEMAEAFGPEPVFPLWGVLTIP